MGCRYFKVSKAFSPHLWLPEWGGVEDILRNPTPSLKTLAGPQLPEPLLDRPTCQLEAGTRYKNIKNRPTACPQPGEPPRGVPHSRVDERAAPAAPLPAPSRRNSPKRLGGSVCKAPPGWGRERRMGVSMACPGQGGGTVGPTGRGGGSTAGHFPRRKWLRIFPRCGWRYKGHLEPGSLQVHSLQACSRLHPPLPAQRRCCHGQPGELASPHAPACTVPPAPEQRMLARGPGEPPNLGTGEPGPRSPGALGSLG